MNTNDILSGLEQERLLVREFLDLSARQLALLDTDRAEELEGLLETRTKLTAEMEAIEATLGEWIIDLQANPSVTAEVIDTLNETNEEIVRLAKRVLDIDERTRRRLQAVASLTRSEHFAARSWRHIPTSSRPQDSSWLH